MMISEYLDNDIGIPEYLKTIKIKYYSIQATIIYNYNGFLIDGITKFRTYTLASRVSPKLV
jgi:hypothetical protein